MYDENGIEKIMQYADDNNLFTPFMQHSMNAVIKPGQTFFMPKNELRIHKITMFQETDV